jgi:hypothetical protein
MTVCTYGKLHSPVIIHPGDGEISGNEMAKRLIGCDGFRGRVSRVTRSRAGAGPMRYPW